MNGFPSCVPNNLIKAYRKKGVNQLFEWQSECLSNKRIFEPTFQNFIYTAPTSAGKTLVAEVIAACNVLTTKRRALFVFPYISNAREKLFDLQSLWRSAHLVVKAFIGAFSSSLQGWSAAVCTIEKANTLINAFIENGMLSEIGVIVVDELHILFDNERGAIIENMLNKILYASRHRNHQIQIIGMSATLEDHKRLAEWLNADYFVSNFRPLNLREFVVIDGVVFDLLARRKDRVLREEFCINSDVKNLIGMTMEAVLENKAVLIFCPTKADTEKYASLLARYVSYCVSKGPTGRFFRLGECLAPPTHRQVVDYFAQKTFCTDADLLGVISTGIAFHHAGLTVEEREEIEFLFRKGSLKVLVSTSTLSSGVNLPAHRVLIMTSASSYIPLNSITYRQMVGRAGRQGQKVVEGESYLLCSKTDWPIIQNQIERIQTVHSPRPTTRIILEAICSGFISTYEELQQLLCYQISSPLENMDVELSQLNDLRLIAYEHDRCDADRSAKFLSCCSSRSSSEDAERNAELQIFPTQLGRATLASSLAPKIATQIFADLENAARSLCLDSELHMLFLVTPINNLAINANAIDWNFYYQRWCELSEPLARVARRVGVTEKFFMQKLGGKAFARDDKILNLHIRFFATLVLYELINEVHLEKVSRVYRINRGLLQALQQQAATYAYMVVSFCDRLGWFYLKALLEGFAERMQFGVRRDLTELVRVPGIDAIRARHFHHNGIKSLVVLANASTDEICRVLRKAVPFLANSDPEQSIKNAWLFGEPPLEDVQAARILIERALEVIKEKMELAAFPLPLFKNNELLNGTSTSSFTSCWLSDDNDLTISELLHDSAVRNLCETLSPLQLDSQSKKNSKTCRPSKLSYEPSKEVSKSDEENCAMNLSAEEEQEIVKELNSNIAKNNEDDEHVIIFDEESFTIDDINISAGTRKTNADKQIAFAARRQQRRSKSGGAEDAERIETIHESTAIPRTRKNQNSSKKQKASKDKIDVSSKELMNKNQLNSAINKQNCNSTPAFHNRVAQKKLWTERVSKGLTPSTNDEATKQSPLQKRRQPLSSTNIANIQRDNNHYDSSTSSTSGNNSRRASRLDVIIQQNSLDGDSLDALLLDDSPHNINLTNMLAARNISHLNSQSSFITDENIFGGAAATSTPLPPRESTDGSEKEMRVAQSFLSLSENAHENEEENFGEHESRSTSNSKFAFNNERREKLYPALLELCHNSILSVSPSNPNSAPNNTSAGVDKSAQKNSLYEDDSLIIDGVRNAMNKLNSAGLPIPTRNDDVRQSSGENSNSNLANDTASESNRADELEADCGRVTTKIRHRGQRDDVPTEGIDEICRKTEPENRHVLGHLLSNASTPKKNLPTLSKENINPFAKSIKQPITPVTSYEKSRPRIPANPKTTPKRKSNLIVLESVRSPASKTFEDGIQMLCRCNWPPTGLFDRATNADATCRAACISNENDEAPIVASSSCALSLTDTSASEVLLFLPITRQCYFLPLKRVAGSCLKCKICDMEALLRELLEDCTVTKWFTDALEFLRVVRRIFSDEPNERRMKKSGRSPTFITKSPISSHNKNQATICFASSWRVCNLGCVRTLNALDVEDSEEATLLRIGASSASNERHPTGSDEWRGTVTACSEASHFKNALRRIAKRLGISKWQPRWSAPSRARFPPSFALRVMSASIDACLTHAVAFSLIQRADQRQRALQRLYLDSLEVLAGVQAAGMAFHWQRATKMVAAIVAQMNETERRVFRLCNDIKFNLDSPDEVAKVLFVKLNLPAPQNATTTRRHLSTNNAVLRQIDHPVAHGIMQWRKLQHAHSALRALLQEAAIQANADSRLRTCFDNFSAAAGRISSSQPNLQFLPKEALIAGKYSARSVFVAPPGMVLMAADYCQLELRVLCELSHDRALARLLSTRRGSDSLPSSTNNNDDDDDEEQRMDDPFDRIAHHFRSFHAQTSSSSTVSRSGAISTDADADTLSALVKNSAIISSAKLKTKTTTLNDGDFVCDRQKAKQLCYAIIYGMGAETLAHEMRISRSEAQTLLNHFFNLFPRVKCWIEKHTNQSRQLAYCETFSGRRRVFSALAAVGESSGEERHRARQAINYIIQGTASEMFRQALINVERMLREEFRSSESIVQPRIVMQLHDELIVEVAEMHVNRCARVLRKVMENVFADRGFRLPFPIKISCGRSWGSLAPF